MQIKLRKCKTIFSSHSAQQKTTSLSTGGVLIFNAIVIEIYFDFITKVMNYWRTWSPESEHAYGKKCFSVPRLHF